MEQFFIIADDLTGASDSGVQFAKRGYPTSLLFNNEDTEGWKHTPGVIVVDTDSRAALPDTAYQRVRDFILSLEVQKNHMIYKKVDSTLRGNIKDEVKAILATVPNSTAFIIPAYPQNGRTTRAGIHYLHGVPVHETEIGRDPKTPVASSYIPDFFAGECFLFDTESIEKGSLDLRNRVQNAIDEKYSYIIFDAETKEHLQTIAELYPLFPQAVWVGSAGIAEYLNPPLPVVKTSPKIPFIRKPLLFLVGSLSESTREQVHACSGDDFFTLWLDPLRLLQSTDSSLAEFIKPVKEAYLSGKHCIVALLSTEEARGQTSRYAADQGITAIEVSDQLRNLLGKISEILSSSLTFECLFLTGGDSARSICEHLGFTRMTILQELEPGIPLGQVNGNHTYLVTKAGAFGNAQTFRHIAELLTKE
jgi:uncharacterized protein YgbK (DUF1537 family)